MFSFDEERELKEEQDDDEGDSTGDESSSTADEDVESGRNLVHKEGKGVGLSRWPGVLLRPRLEPSKSSCSSSRSVKATQGQEVRRAYTIPTDIFSVLLLTVGPIFSTQFSSSQTKSRWPRQAGQSVNRHEATYKLLN